MVFDNKQFKVPYDSYVSVNNQVFDADVYITLPTQENFSYSNCVAVFFVTDETVTRRYCQFGFYECFSNDTLKDINFKGYFPLGVYLFFKDKKFLEDFKATNKYII